MANAQKVLGQVNPTAATLTTLYTVPSATSAVVSTLAVCNLSGTDATFRVAVRVAGAASTNKQYLCYDIKLPGAATRVMTLGIGLATTDVLSVYASSGNVAFQAFGLEVS